MHPIFENFRQHLQKKYFASQPALTDSLTPNLISPFVLKLPKSVLTEARNIVADTFKLSKSPRYRALVQPSLPFSLDEVQQTPSLLNSLDIHIDTENKLKIIEINTNASSYLVNLENYLQQGIGTFPQAYEDLKTTFVKTFADHLKPGALFLVMDENPSRQNLYIEFLMFKDFLQKEFSVNVEIADAKELTLASDKGLLWQGQAVSGIYNRFTDFYFSTNAALAEAYRHQTTLISPNPLTYGLLADKKRFYSLTPDFFAELQEKENLSLPHLSAAVLTAKRFAEFSSKDELWKTRSQYFFKPPNSYGGKSVYRGKSISHVVFDRIYTSESGPDYIAQQLAAPPEVTFDYEGASHTFKYDLRFYFFEGEIQLAAARIYQGQLTNLKTPLGGLTPIEFV
jgi:glutathionylspermidine synthase